MAYEHKAGFQTYEHVPPANTRTHYTNISFYDTVAQSTANIRTCFSEHAHTMFMRTHFTNMQKCWFSCPDFTAENAPWKPSGTADPVRRVRWTKRAGELHSSEYNRNTFWSSSRPVLPVLPRPPVSPVLSALWVRRGSQRMIVISGVSQYQRFYKFAIKSLSELMCCIFGRLTVSANWAVCNQNFKGNWTCLFLPFDSITILTDLRQNAQAKW